MKSAVVTEFGDEQNVQFVKNAPMPSCAAHEVVIQVKVCALGRTDLEVRQGLLAQFVREPPLVSGFEVSGVVHEKGSEVSNVDVGQEVVAVIPLDSAYGGCADYTVVDVINVVAKPELVTHEEAASSLVSGLEAYTAFHYHMNMRPNEFLLICAANFAADTLAIQLAGHLGAKVIVTASTNEELNAYGDCGSTVARVVDLSSENVVDAVMEETGGLGVNCVLDLQAPRLRAALDTLDASDPNSQIIAKRLALRASKHLEQQQVASDVAPGAGAGADVGSGASLGGPGSLQESGAPASSSSPSSSSSSSSSTATATAGAAGANAPCEPYVTKRDIIQCLAAHGRWVTCSPDMQLDPPEAQQLYFRGASLSFMFVHTWLMAPIQHGRYLHIIQDILARIADGTIRSTTKAKVYPIEKVRQAHRELQSTSMGKVVIKLA